MQPRKYSIIVAAIAALLPAYAQTSRPLPEFEAADIRLNNSGSLAMQGGILPGGQISVRNMLLKDLIVEAYKAAGVEGGPGWLDSDRFDIVAKAPPNTAEDTLRPMLQALLAQRFKLAIHLEQRSTAVFALVTAKGGAKLQPAAGTGQPKCGAGQGAPGMNHTACTNVTMADLASLLKSRIAPSFIDRPIVDLTGLKGAYDIRLDWIPRPILANGADGDAAGASVFDALEKQLGLKLEQRKRPMPVVVIDHIERVSSN